MKYNVIELYNEELLYDDVKLIINRKIIDVIKMIEFGYSYDGSDNYIK